MVLVKGMRKGAPTLPGAIAGQEGGNMNEVDVTESLEQALPYPQAVATEAGSEGGGEGAEERRAHKESAGQTLVKADAPSDPLVSRSPSAFVPHLLQIWLCLPFGLQSLLRFSRGLQPASSDTSFEPLGAGGEYPDPDQVVKEIPGA